MLNFKAGDEVIYYGPHRPHCPHSNQEVGRILSTPNGANHLYTIQVLDVSLNPLMTTSFGYQHPVTWLSSDIFLHHWIRP